MLRRSPGRLARGPVDPFSGQEDGRVRCGLVTPALAYGGAERWLLDLIRWTDPERIRWVGVALTREMGGAPETMAEVQGLCPLGVGEAAAAALARKCDALLYWGIPQFERMVPAEAGCRVIGVSHGSGPWTARCFTSDYPQGWDLVAVAREALAPLPPPLRQRATVIYNGVDRSRLAPRLPGWELRAQWGVPDGAPVAGFLGRLSAEKNPRTFVEMLAHLPRQWWGVLVGVGADLPLIRAEAQRLGVCQRLVTPGFREDVGSALAAFDWLVMPAHEEGYGLALVEGMLARVPVISTPVGIVPEIPDLVRPVPLQPTPEQLALAVLLDAGEWDATRERVLRAESWALRHATVERFGEAWTAYLAGG